MQRLGRKLWVWMFTWLHWWQLWDQHRWMWICCLSCKLRMCWWHWNIPVCLQSRFPRYVTVWMLKPVVLKQKCSRDAFSCDILILILKILKSFNHLTYKSNLYTEFIQKWVVIFTQRSDAAILKWQQTKQSLERSSVLQKLLVISCLYWLNIWVLYR